MLYSVAKGDAFYLKVQKSTWNFSENKFNSDHLHSVYTASGDHQLTDKVES